jgi:hypothetical protein
LPNGFRHYAKHGPAIKFKEASVDRVKYHIRELDEIRLFLAQNKIGLTIKNPNANF